MNENNTVTITIGQYQAMAIAQENFQTLVGIILKRAVWSNYTQGFSFRDEDINTALAVLAPGRYNTRIHELKDIEEEV